MVKDLQETNKIVKYIERKGFSNIYIHMDLDVLDSKHFPSVKCPTPYGTTVLVLNKLIKALKNNFTVAGHSILESTQLNRSSTSIVNSIIKSLCSRNVI
jgi:arginase